MLCDFKLWFIPAIVSAGSKLLARTLRLRVEGEERVAGLQMNGKGVILVTWHGRTFIPITRFNGRGYWAIISPSRDGEYQNRIFRRFGWQTVRGSTGARGAVQSALTMVKHLKAGATLAFTPDGPRGPSREVQPGAIFLAQKSGCAIVPAGISVCPRRLLPTWDRYLVPMPFGRAALVYGEPLYIPAGADEAEQRVWAGRVKEAIDRLEARAEAITGADRAKHAERRDRQQVRPV